MKHRISDADCQFAFQGEGLGPASFVRPWGSSSLKTFALPVPHLAPTLPLATRLSSHFSTSLDLGTKPLPSWRQGQP